LSLYLQGVESVFDLDWGGGLTYGELFHTAEAQGSRYNFEKSDAAQLLQTFDGCEKEANTLLAEPDSALILPAYDTCLQLSHLFNLLDARGALSVTERARFIGRVRSVARRCAQGYLALREAQGFPLLRHSSGSRSKRHTKSRKAAVSRG